MVAPTTVRDTSPIDRLAGVAQQVDALTFAGSSAQDLCGCCCDDIQQERQGQNRQQPGHAGSTARSLARDGAGLAHLAEQRGAQGNCRSKGKGMEPVAKLFCELAQLFQHLVPPRSEFEGSSN